MSTPARVEGVVVPREPRRLPPELALAAGSVAAVLLVLLAVELVLRFADPGALATRPLTSLARLHRYSEAYGWEPRPGAVAEVDGRRTSINARGLRGALHPLERTSRPRLLMLGDSIAFGYGVADGETFSDRLEERGVEVVNLAVEGYGTDQALLRLTREGMAYRPDVVLLHFCVDNDFVDNASRTYFYDGVHPKPYFTLDGDGLAGHDAHLQLGTMNRLTLRLRERSLLFNRLVGERAPLEQDWPARRAAALRETPDVGELTARLVERAAAVAAAGGARFLLLFHPCRHPQPDDAARLAALRASPRLAAVAQVDMGERYRARGLSVARLTLDSLGHLNPHGHREAAGVIDELVRADR